MAFHVGIIGTGPAGLVVALALEKATGPDVRLTLLDRNRSPADHPGVEYGIQARACRALDRLGLKEEALAAGHPGERIVLHLARTGEDQAALPVDQRNTFGVERGEFLATLTGLLRRAEVLRGHDVTAIAPLPDRRVRLDVRTAAAEDRPTALEFDVVVACDGVHSVARRRYFPEAGTFDRGFSIIYLLVEGHPDDPRTPGAFPRVANGGTSELVMGSFSTSALFPQGRNRLTMAFGCDHATAARVWRQHGVAPRTPWKDIPSAIKEEIARTLARDTPVHGG